MSHFKINCIITIHNQFVVWKCTTKHTQVTSEVSPEGDVAQKIWITKLNAQLKNLAVVFNLDN